MLRLMILVALSGLASIIAYAVYRWRRTRALAAQRVLQRERHDREKEVWDRMLADMATKRQGTDDSAPKPVET